MCENRTRLFNSSVLAKASLGGLAALAMLSAAPAASAQVALDEIVVTAQKREQDIQDVGIAVSAVTAERLIENPTSNAMDLVARVPSISAGENFGFAQIFIRGIGVDNLFNGADPSVAMHVDGVVIGRPTAQMGVFFDLERIEVLRGPQGTLYGRNATGGSINLITNKPTDTPSGYVRTTVGNYEKVLLEGALSGPLGTDMLLGRLAVQLEDRGGYGKNLFNGLDIDDAQRRAVRGQLWINPEGALNALISAEYYSEDDSAHPYHYYAETFPGDPRPSFRNVALMAGGRVAADPRDIDQNVQPVNDRESRSVTATVNWQLNEAFRAVSISNYRDFELRNLFDFDFTSAAFFIEGQPEKARQISQELQLHYTSDRATGLLGAYFIKERLFGQNRLGGPGVSDSYAVPLGALAVAFSGSVEIEAWALFGNLSLELTDTLSLVVGGRYSSETREGKTDFYKTPAPIPPATFRDKKSFEDFSPKIGLEWRPREQLLVYGTYSQGFKSGIFLTGSNAPVLKPETVDAYEFGLKGRFFDNRLQTNVSLFYYDFQNLQVGRTEPQLGPNGQPNGGFSTIFENAAAATNQGIEVEASWAVTENLRLDGFIGYLDAKFDSFLTKDPLLANTPAGQTFQQAGGNRMVQSPEWTANLRAQYERPVEGWGEVFAALELAYKDKVYFTPFNSERLSQDAVTTVDANIGLRSVEDHWMVNLWGKNLTDELIWASLYPISTTRSIGGAPSPPRTFGVTVGLSF